MDKKIKVFLKNKKMRATATPARGMNSHKASQAEETARLRIEPPFSLPEGINFNISTSGSPVLSSSSAIRSIPDDVFGEVYVYGPSSVNAQHIREHHEQYSSNSETGALKNARSKKAPRNPDAAIPPSSKE